MTTLFRITLLIGAIGAFIGYNLVNLEKASDRFMERVNLEVLEKYDPNLGPNFMVDPIAKIAEEERILLPRENIGVGFINPDNISSASALEAISQDSVGEVVAITLTYDIKRHFMTRRFTKTIDKALEDWTVSGANRESPGFPHGVDLPVPARGVQSYRDSVRKSIGERTDY